MAPVVTEAKTNQQIVDRPFRQNFRRKLDTDVVALPMMVSWEEAMTVAKGDAVAKDKEVGQKVGNDLRIPMLYLRTLCVSTQV